MTSTKRKRFIEFKHICAPIALLLSIGTSAFWWGPPKKIICSFEFGKETNTFPNIQKINRSESIPQWDFAIEVFDGNISYQRIADNQGPLDIIDAKTNKSLIKFEFDWMAPFHNSSELVTVIINRRENTFTWRQNIDYGGIVKQDWDAGGSCKAY